ncbi:MAG: DUF262 domain-containing protein [Gemmatimonadaceae bacterium]
MKPTTVTPDDLFRTQRRYIIPLFQRGYVWTREEQWSPLWRDIVLLTREVEKADKSGGGTSNLRRHFLGAIVLEPKPARIRHVTDHAVVDGQQRLTTIQLLLLAVRDILAPTEDADLLRELSLLTLNEGQWASEEERYKLWPTNVGRSAWKKVVSAGSAEQVRDAFPFQKQKVKRKNRWVRPPLAEAYLYFHSQIADYLKGGPGLIASEDDAGVEEPPNALNNSDGKIDLNRAKYLVEAVTKYFQVVAIELEATDDPQVIFETLNGRMAPLTPADLIRNFVFVAAVRRGLDTERLYQDIWCVFDYDPGSSPDVPGFWRGSQKQGRRFHNRLDLFVFHYLTMRTGREIALIDLFRSFQHWWDGADASPDDSVAVGVPEPRDPVVELSRMVRVATSMRVLLAPDDVKAGPLNKFAKRLQVLDTTTPFPLLLYLAERENAIGEQLEGCLTDLESYLIRRMLCDLTTKNYNQVMLRALGAVRLPGASTRQALQSYLLSLEGDATRWPTDEELLRGIQLSPAYKHAGPARTEMVLRALELAHYSGKEEGVVVPKLTIEHVMPQNPTSVADWPYPSGNQSPTLEELQLRFALRETLGNLTLVTQPLNSSLSNGAFPAKKAKLAEESQLRMNRYFANFPRDAWLERDIVDRSKALGEKALKLWPRPVNVHAGAAPLPGATSRVRVG